MDKVITKKNPVISKQGVCDPHVHIFNDRVYLYASHDVPVDPKVSFFRMNDWEIWSSPDFVTWEKESIVRPEETSMGASNECWAVDAAEKNGKYYLYVSNGMSETYVLSSDDPGKGFKDALGKPILPKWFTKTCSYDPTAFIDDDGTPYILFGTPVWAGGDSYYIAKLNEDMISLAETPRKIELNNAADDKCFLHKHDGTYYLTWASYYATSDNVYGPYKFRGNINLTTDHGSFFDWNGQSYMAFTVSETLRSARRATGFAYIHYKENGDMCADDIIREYGVGQYDGTWNRIEAEWFTKGHNVTKKENTYGGFDVVMKEGSWVEFSNIRGIPAQAYMTLWYAAAEKVEIEVYEGDKLLTTAMLNDAQMRMDCGYTAYTHAVLPLFLPEGDHNIRIVAKGDLKLDWFNFITE